MFSSRIKSLRISKKLTQEEMAEKIGVARTTYAMYEQGKREPDYLTLKKISDFHAVSTDYLLGLSDSISINTKNNDLSEEDRKMLEFFKNPELNLFFKEMAQSEEGKLGQLRKIWEAIKDDIK